MLIVQALSGRAKHFIRTPSSSNKIHQRSKEGMTDDLSPTKINDNYLRRLYGLVSRRL